MTGKRTLAEQQALPRAEKLRLAVAIRDDLWSRCMSWPEDERIARLEAECAKLMRGDAQAGADLATEALWG